MSQASNPTFKSVPYRKEQHCAEYPACMPTNLAQEGEVGREKRARQPPRWRYHKCIRKENGLYLQNRIVEYQRNTLRNKNNRCWKDFIQYNGINIIFLQEVVHEDQGGYTAHTQNIGTDQRDTAILKISN
jgi:hypothetical protein